jgi:diacylglycerol kinase
MKQKQFSVQARAKSTLYAWAGLRALLAAEHNMYIHLALTAATILCAVVFRVRPSEAIVLIVAMALVWMAELFNTAIEKTADLISEEYHPQIKFVKDVAAAAVLVAAVAAFLIGCIIFIPKFFLQ